MLYDQGKDDSILQHFFRQQEVKCVWGLICILIRDNVSNIFALPKPARYNIDAGDL